MLIEHLPGEPTSFTVIPYNDPHPVQIKLTARNRHEKRQWAQHIKQVMLAHFDIPSRAKELVFKLGDEEGEWRRAVFRAGSLVVLVNWDLWNTC